jgi:hypothetical protein
MTALELIVIALIVLGGVLLARAVLSHQPRWVTLYVGQEWDSRDAVDLHTELEKHDIRAHLSFPIRVGMGGMFTDAFVPDKREITVHVADVEKARPIMRSWAQRYREQRETEPGQSPSEGAPPGHSPRDTHDDRR